MRHSLDVHALRERLLAPSSPWTGLDFFDSVDSTNAEALRHPQPWRLVLADHQSAGRGRLARAWQAPERASVAISAVLPLSETSRDGSAPPAGPVGWLPLLAGLAMRAALEEVGGVRVGLKWPNDLLAGAATAPDDQLRKICGILCQSVGSQFVVVGAGANLDQSRDELPVDTATSLLLCGAEGVSREDVVVTYLDHLHEMYVGWAAGGASLATFQAHYRSNCLTIGQEVDVHRPGGGTTRGRAVGVDGDGRLEVAEPVGAAGRSRTVAHAAGDVVHLRRADLP